MNTVESTTDINKENLNHTVSIKTEFTFKYNKSVTVKWIC